MLKPAARTALCPLAGLVQASDGNFYGTTLGGGANGGYGTVFKITPGGTLTTLHSFDGADGAWTLSPGWCKPATATSTGQPTEAGLTISGTVFKITPQGTLTTLHSFNFTDGINPWAGVVQASDGNFYGTTAVTCCGTVFRLVSVRPCFSCALQWK